MTSRWKWVPVVLVVAVLAFTAGYLLSRLRNGGKVTSVSEGPKAEERKTPGQPDDWVEVRSVP